MNTNISRLPLGEQKMCELCGEGVISIKMETQPFTYGEGDSSVDLEAYVPVMSCSACGEQFTGEDAERIRHNVVCDYMNRLNPDQLRDARTTSGYSQSGWAEFTRLGIASIKRWESGTQIQSASSDLLIRMLADPQIRSIAEDLGNRCGSRTDRQDMPTFQVITIERHVAQAARFELRRRNTH